MDQQKQSDQKEEALRQESEFFTRLKNFNLTLDDTEYDEIRYLDLKRNIDRLARVNRSVNMIRNVLELIYIQDLDNYIGDYEEINDIITTKLVLT